LEKLLQIGEVLAGAAADEGSTRNRHQLAFLQCDSFVLCKRVWKLAGQGVKQLIVKVRNRH